MNLEWVEWQKPESSTNNNFQNRTMKTSWSKQFRLDSYKNYKIELLIFAQKIADDLTPCSAPLDV